MSEAPATEDLTEGVTALRALIVSGEQLRHAIAEHWALGVSETTALSHLRLHDGLSPRELSDRLGLTPSTLTSLLDRLEVIDFIRRSPHPTDRRMTIISLAEPGEKLLNRSDEWLSAAVGRLGAEALPDVAAAMTRLAAGLGEQAKEIKSLPRRERYKRFRG